jgi:hypothetical protein
LVQLVSLKASEPNLDMDLGESEQITWHGPQRSAPLANSFVPLINLNNSLFNLTPLYRYKQGVRHHSGWWVKDLHKAANLPALDANLPDEMTSDRSSVSNSAAVEAKFLN